ncbi:MAG: S-adenosylmethionine:tRNA ribosyltransferase-isomerase, partial [Pseudomonadota bacterium]
MRATDFEYLLPSDRVAVFPSAAREDSRLLRLNRFDGKTTHHAFREIGAHLPPASLIVVNDARVIPARLRGTKPNGGTIELLLIRRVSGGGGGGAPGESDAPGAERWEALGRNLSRAARGTRLSFAGGLQAEVLEHGASGALVVSLRAPDGGETVAQALERVGELPLPPYIEAARKREIEVGGGLDGAAVDPRHRHASDIDRERYQTVYAAVPGAVAAPTAGLHFTTGLLAELTAAGHSVARLTLDVGLGTFRP